jgi:hypothetical protein
MYKIPNFGFMQLPSLILAIKRVNMQLYVENNLTFFVQFHILMEDLQCRRMETSVGIVSMGSRPKKV